MNSPGSPAQAPPPAAAQAVTPCYHCGLPVPPGVDLRVRVRGGDRPMCCRGCEAVARTIVESGLDDFYRLRTATSSTGRDLLPEALKQAEVFDKPQVSRQLVRETDEHRCEVALILEDIACPACVWVNENYLRRLPGVLRVRVNYSTRRARVLYDDRRLQLSDILKAVQQLGYRAHPYDPLRHQQVSDRERATLLKQIGVAGVFGMQVMMVALAFYLGDNDVATEYRQLFNGLNLLLTAPVVVYSARPFFRSAWRGLSRLALNMDVSVSLGISLAFGGSAWTTISGRGEVYFDSVVMFVLLLLIARYFEFMARARASATLEALNRQQPTTATRLRRDGDTLSEETVVAADLRVGDRVLVRPGEVIPADGTVAAGFSSVDESLLTGEGMPVAKRAGSHLIGGSINVESPLQVTVGEIGEATVLARILHVLENAQAERPRLTMLADRLAGWFVLGVILASALTGGYGWATGNAHWFANVLAVLVITCPCALSLATPAAISCAINALMRGGVLVVRSQALETLARATHVVFDKTGTLTRGRPRLSDVVCWSAMTPQECLVAAAALERFSEHPLARAILAAAGPADAAAGDVISLPGQGVEGTWRGRRWFVGSAGFIRARSAHPPQEAAIQALRGAGDTLVVLADAETAHCVFRFNDALREGARDIIAELKGQGLQVLLLTGDQRAAAERIAQMLGIGQVEAGVVPAQKLACVQDLQARGAVVAMVGDGINDAPVLAGAQVSIAMDSGAALARASADLILLGGRFEPLQTAFRHARKTLRIVRENLVWAIGYNALALPAAMAGLVSPWLAALGMSLSSLLVVGNALRLTVAATTNGRPRA